MTRISHLPAFEYEDANLLSYMPLACHGFVLEGLGCDFTAPMIANFAVFAGSAAKRAPKEATLQKIVALVWKMFE